MTQMRYPIIMRTWASVVLFALGLAGPAEAQVSVRNAAFLALARETPSAEANRQTPSQPPPEHTGFQALIRSTASDFASFPKRPSTWVILAIGAAGAAAVHPIDDDLNARLVGNETVSRVFAPGKYIGLGSVQAAAAVTTYLVGRYVLPKNGERRSNKVSHLGFDLVRAQIVTQALTAGIKQTVRRERPDGTCCAFPSGHASTTFATAAVLERHLGLRHAWPTLLIAAYVGASRLHDNRHFASDVVFGAALGTAVGWTVVGRHGRSDYTLIPVRLRGGIAVSLVRVAPRAAEPGRGRRAARQSTR